MRNVIRSWKHKEKAKEVKQYGRRYATKYDTEFMDLRDIDDEGKEEEI